MSIVHLFQAPELSLSFGCTLLVVTWTFDIHESRLSEKKGTLSFCTNFKILLPWTFYQDGNNSLGVQMHDIVYQCVDVLDPEFQLKDCLFKGWLPCDRPHRKLQPTPKPRPCIMYMTTYLF